MIIVSTVILICIIVLVANIIQGITGFAGTLIALPFLIMLIKLNLAKQMLNVLGILVSLVILAKDYHYISWRVFGKIVVLMTVGLLIGLAAYSYIRQKILLNLFAFFVLVVGIYGLFVTNLHLHLKKDYPFLPLTDSILLLGGGIIHGLYVAGGPLLVIYAAHVLTNKYCFRATLSLVWLYLNTIIFLVSWANHQVTSAVGIEILIAVIPMVAGTLIGDALLKKIKQQTFLNLTYLLLILSGVSLLT